MRETNRLSSNSLLLIENAFTELQNRDIADKTKQLQMEALRSLPSYLHPFLERHMMMELIDSVCQKKIAFIMQAKTAGAIKEIMKPPRPVWTGNGLTCGSPYHIPEEELLMWAHISPHLNLTSVACERYMQLFEQVLGISTHELMHKTDAPEIDLNF